MLDCDFMTEKAEYNCAYVDEHTEDYCTNPMNEKNETSKTSWLDDFGWI